MSTTTAPVPTPARPRHTARPRRAPGTAIHPPTEGSQQWVLQRGQRYIRVGAEVARLAESMDGERDHAALAASLGGTWSPEKVAGAVDRLDGLELVDRGDMEEPGRPPRLRFVPPLTLQLTLLRPGATMQRMRPFFALLASPVSLAVALLVALGGLAALAAQAATVDAVLSEPLPMATYLAVLLGLIVGTSIHEIGHAATLIRHGGEPSRIGVMLFYLLPAFFCDVSDSWRLPRRRQRVQIALAGPAVQTFLAGVAAFVAWAMPPSPYASAVLFFAIGSYVTGLLNLVPLVKLDGYIALMSAVDIPYLRLRAMTDARRWIARMLFGGTYERELDRRWTTAYGLACLAFPAYLILTAMGLWLDVLQRGGLFGLAFVAIVLAYALHLTVRGVRRVLAEVRSAGASRHRVLSVSALVAAALVAGAWIPVGHTARGAFVPGEDGPLLVIMDGSGTAGIEPGSPVHLGSNGAVIERDRGRARIAEGDPQRATAPLSAFFPFDVDGVPELPVTAYRLDGDVPADAMGSAEVDLGTVPAWKHVYRSYIEPFWAR